MTNQASDMPLQTLHQLTLPPRQWAQVLAQITQVWQANDILLLMAEATQGYSDQRLKAFDQIAVLQSDADMLSSTASGLESVQVLSYAQWAELTVQYNRTITWR